MIATKSHVYGEIILEQVYIVPLKMDFIEYLHEIKFLESIIHLLYGTTGLGSHDNSKVKSIQNS